MFFFIESDRGAISFSTYDIMRTLIRPCGQSEFHFIDNKPIFVLNPVVMLYIKSSNLFAFSKIYLTKPDRNLLTVSRNINIEIHQVVIHVWLIVLTFSKSPGFFVSVQAKGKYYQSSSFHPSIKHKTILFGRSRA